MLPLPTNQDIQAIAQTFGRKTINEIRLEAGIDPVDGGDIAYVDWLKRLAGLPLVPDLKVVPNLWH